MVDDEEDLIWMVSRQVVRERPDLALEGFTKPERALERLKEAPPDVLVTDIRMPRLSGLELMREARRVAPNLPVIFITAYSTPGVRQEVLSRGGVDFIEKPFEFSVLLAAIDKLLHRSTGFSGAISLPMLPDLVQIYALSKASGALRITRDEERGEIWFERGAIVHASSGTRAGAPAFYELLTWEGGSFWMEPAGTPPERSIGVGWEELLIEGCRLLDERNATSRPDDADDVFLLRDALRHADRDQQPGESMAGVTGMFPDAVTARRSDTSHAIMPAATAIIEITARITGSAPSGVVEATGERFGVALFWNSTDVVAAGTPVAGATGVSRFRSNVAHLARQFNEPATMSAFANKKE